MFSFNSLAALNTTVMIYVVVFIATGTALAHFGSGFSNRVMRISTQVVAIVFFVMALVLVIEVFINMRFVPHM